MTREEFEKIVEEEFPRAVPERFHNLIENVAFLVEDEPDLETRCEHNLGEHETLLGLYKGISHVDRGEWYGVGATLPDTITLYQKPIEEEAQELLSQAGRRVRSGPLGQVLLSSPQPDFEAFVRQVVRETIWHEVAHYFGYDEHQVQGREAKRNAEE